MIDVIAGEPPDGHVQLQVDDVELGAREERSVLDLLLHLVGPHRHVRRGELLTCLLLLRGVGHEEHGGDLRAQILHVAHHRLVACGLEVVGGVQAVLASDEDKDGVRLRERRPSRHFEDGDAAEGGARLHREPRVALETNVLEVHAGDMHGGSTLLATEDRAPWLRLMVEHPILIERPILVLSDGRAVIGRTDEALEQALRG